MKTQTQVLNPENWEKVAEYINNSSPETKVYVGSDSKRRKAIFNGKRIWVADYAVCIAVHLDGRHGCVLFGEVTRDPDYDQKKNRPALRLMNEVYKLAEIYNDLQERVDRKLEVPHLDLNPSKTHGSSCVVTQAIGYIKGVCGVTPLVKHDAFAASFAADRLQRILSEREENTAELSAV